MADNEVKSADSSEQISAVSKRCKSSLRSPDVSSTNDPRLGETEVAVSSEQIANQVVNLTRRKNRRKRDRALLLKDSDYAPSGCSNNGLAIIQDEVQDVKVSSFISYKSTVISSGFLYLFDYAKSIFLSLISFTLN